MATAKTTNTSQDTSPSTADDRLPPTVVPGTKTELPNGLVLESN